MSALLKDRPDLQAAQETYVYFARAFPSGLIKIGYSGRPNNRMSGVMRESGERVSVLFTLSGNRVQERGFHKRFDACRFKGRGKEWFYETDILHDYLKERGHAGTKVVIEKHVVLEPAPTRYVEVLKPIYLDRAKQANEPKPCFVGYARVSTEDQNLDVQLQALRASGVQDENLFVEKISAVNAHRPQFNLMMKFLEPGDTLFFHSLSRMGREAIKVIEMLRNLSADGITWKSLTEAHLDSETAIGRFMVTMTSAKDQLERDQIIERTKRGMAECKRKGMFLGRKRIITPEIQAKMQKLRGADVAVVDIAAKFSIKPSTVYANTKPKK